MINSHLKNTAEKDKITMFDNLEEEYSYIVRIYTAEGFKYLYNPRTFLIHMEYAKRYTSLQSAQRVARAVRNVVTAHKS